MGASGGRHLAGTPPRGSPCWALLCRRRGQTCPPIPLPWSRTLLPPVPANLDPVAASPAPAWLLLQVLWMGEAEVIRCAGIDAALYLKILRMGEGARLSLVARRRPARGGAGAAQWLANAWARRWLH